MKKLIWFIAIFLLLIPAALAEEVIATGDMLHFATGDAGVWVCADGELTYYPEDGAPVPMGPMTNIWHMAGDGETVYLHLSDAAGQRILGLSLDGTTVFDAALPPDLYLREFAISDGYLIALSPDVPPADGSFPLECAIYVAPLTNPLVFQPMVVDDFPNATVTAMSVSDGLLYTCQPGVYTVIDIARSEVLLRTESATALDYEILGKRTEDGRYVIYSSYNNKLFRFDLLDGTQVTELSDFSMGGSYRTTRSAVYYRVTENDQPMRLLRLKLDTDLSNNRQLSVWNITPNARAEAAIRLFAQRYPQVDVALYEEYDSRVIATNMLAGEIDLLCAQDYPLTVEQYYRSGALRDLRTYPAIAEQLEHFADVFACVSLDDHLLGIPTDYYAPMFIVNEALFHQLGLTVPTPGWTWDDFFALAEQVQAYNQQHGAAIHLLDDNAYSPVLFEVITANAMDVLAGKSDYLRPAFIEAMEKWRTIEAAGLISHSTINLADLNFLPKDVLLMSESSVVFQQLSRKPYLTLPVFDETTRLPVSTQKLVLNAKSDMEEEAVHFLACYLSLEAVQAESITYSGPILKDDQREPLPYWGKMPSEATTAMWMDLLAQSGIPMDIGEAQREQRGELLPRFLAGDLTAEAFLTLCQRTADMMLGE